MSARFVPCIEHCDEANGLLLPAATTEERSNHSITHTGRLNPRITFCSRRRPPVEGKILVLKQFVKKYRSLFPLCVSVAQGYCNPELGYEVTAGELYMLILTRTMKWIVVADRCGKQKLIPMNSHVEYTFLYNPDGDLERAKRGYILPTVRDILDRRTRPYVIRATRGYEGDTEEDSVEQSEVLIVLKQKRRGFGDSSLSVYSVTLGMTKLLPSHCLGDFSTNPYATKLRITEILGHIDMSFPAKVCLFIVPEFDKEIDPCLLEDPMDVLGLRSTKSVLANLVSSHDNALETYDPNNQPLEIPLYLPITVSVHSHKPADSDSHTARLVPLVFETPNLKTETLDTDLSERPYQTLNETYGKDSDALYEVVGPRATYTTRNLNSEIIHGVRVLEKSLKDTNDTIGILIKEIHSLHRCVENSERYPQPSEDEAIRNRRRVESVTAGTRLSTLSVQQVCTLLESLGLAQYTAIVTTERVSGGILSQLTEDELRDELKITSRLHRLRLMEIINGTVPIDLLLSDWAQQ